ncbi:EamA family transporter [Salinifilum aidingensis]
MGLAASLLLLAAAFAHAGWNLFAKRAGGGAAFVWLAAACSAVLYLPLGLLVLWREGAPAGEAWALGVGVSAVLHLGYYLLLQHGYGVADMSVVYPLARGTGPLLAVLAAVLLLGKRPGAQGVLGGLLVVAGVFVIGFAGGAARSGARVGGVAFGLLTGALIASYTVWDAHAVTGLALSPLLFDWSSSVVRAALLGPYAGTQRARVRAIWREHRREVLAVAVLSPLAYVLALFAMRLAPVSLVAPGRELSIVIAGLLAWRVLGEPRPARRLTGAAVVLVGVVLLGVA